MTINSEFKSSIMILNFGSLNRILNLNRYVFQKENAKKTNNRKFFDDIYLL